jgi:signal transduction histidine kinase
LGILLGFLFYFNYQQKIEQLREGIFAQMRLCSFDLQCPDFDIGFKKKDTIKPLFLYEKTDALVSYFEFVGSKENYLSITYSSQKYKEAKLHLLRKASYHYILFLLILGFVSLLFSFYALYPMKKALFTIEEFIKDILHDVNTPITTIVLNSSLLKKDEKNSSKIQKIQQSTQKILSIQDNLKSYLEDLATQKEEFDLRDLILQQKKYTSGIYPTLEWEINNRTLKLKTNRDIFARIISNLISNAAKYNVKNGKIIINIDQKNKTLSIKDTGIGIKDPDKIFERFYTEGERGTGIGLHIVKKLCNELKIDINVTTLLKECSMFTLDLRAVIK